ncbi:hypothetical protein X943_001743 [Babesia divergens]|uniref:Uncharacterized protein n=1 Tax=Babesia divergens TaxID=32595 RepID=A0AAD9GD07_BABDI|nr:hypothetical protein X943_001743 [Babesia divergens]
MGDARTPAIEALRALEQKCTAFTDAVKLAAKESAKIGSGMKTKYNELMSNVNSVAKTLAKSTDAKDLLSFPVKLACCTLLDGVTFANSKTKPLLALNTAIQQLFSIVEFLYSCSSINTTSISLVRIPLEGNDLYIYVDMLFKIFEATTKVEKLEDTVHLRIVQTLLQFLSSASPILLYEDIVRRIFVFLDDLLGSKSKDVKSIVEGGMRQLIQCMLTNPRGKHGALGAVSSIANSYSTSSVRMDEMIYVDIVVDLICSCCSVIRKEKPEFMRNLDIASANEMLLLAITTLPKGMLFEVPRLRDVAKNQLYATVKYVLAGCALVKDECMLLARILEHGYFYSNRSQESDRGIVNLYETLFNFVELNLIDNSSVEGKLRKVAWMRGMALLMQSNEMLNDMCSQKDTRKFMIDVLKFSFKQTKISKGVDLEPFFDGAYKSGNGQQLISEQIDIMDQERMNVWPGYMKIIPLFAVQLEPASCAMDFCNLTNGVMHKISRFNITDSMELEKLEVVETAVVVDVLLVASHVIYSLVVGSHRYMTCFAPYRTFYPKIPGEDSTVSTPTARASCSTEVCDGAETPYRQCAYIREIVEILIQQLDKMMNTMTSHVMQEAFLAVLQGLLVVCKVFEWKEHYMRCLEIMTAHLVLTEKEFSAGHKTCSIETWSLYLSHIRALNALLMNYPSALIDVTWDNVLEHLLAFLFISHQLGVDHGRNMRVLEPRQVDEIMVTSKELHVLWQSVMTETMGAFDRIRVHDFETLGKFVTYFGFHVVIPLLSKSHYVLEPDTVAGSKTPQGRLEKLAIIQRTLDAWPDEFVNMIEKDHRGWPQLMRDLAQALDRKSILANADSQFLHSLFGTITELPYAREHDSLMLLTGIVMLLVRDCGALELMIETICGNIVSLFLAGNEEGKRAIDAGVAVLYKTMYDNASLNTHVIRGLKTICTTVPQILAASKGIINCLAFAAKNATDTNDASMMVVLIDIFVAIVEDSVDSLQDESCLPFVECLFILARGAYRNDNNAAFRVIGVVLDFAEKMAAQSHFFGGERPVRVGEEKMWASVFRGLRGLGLSEFSEIRQCSIKSLAMFVKSRINRFDMTIWQSCCTEMLMPLAEGLLNSLQSAETNQAIFIACDELSVAMREADERYRDDCQNVMTTLVSGLERVVNSTLNNKNLLPNELNTALSSAVGISTNVVIDYSHSGDVWDKCIAILQLMSSKELDLLRQNFFKSVCTILSVFGQRENFPEDKVKQIICLAIGERSSIEKDDFDALCRAANSGGSITPEMLVPPWIFVDYLPKAGACGTFNGDNIWLDMQPPSTPQTTDDQAKHNNEHDSTRDMSELCKTLKDTDETRIKITLRDKIQNSVGILQEMQMLQLVTLHYSPNILAETDALDKVTSVEIPKSLYQAPPEPCDSNSGESSMKSTLKTVLQSQGRKIMIDNMIAHIKVPPLMTLVEAYSPISKLFRCLGSIKTPEVYDMLVNALVSKYLVVEISNVRLSLQLMYNIVLSVREVLQQFLTGAAAAITGDEADCQRFTKSREYRMLMHVVVPMVPMLLEVARRMIEKRAVQPVAIILYQECINLAKYVYFGLFIHTHFLDLEPVLSQPVVDYWRAVMRALDFFVQLNFPDDVGMRLRYMRMLHAVTLEIISALVVNPFSIAPPFIYGSIVKVLDSFACGQSAVLRRIALQRLSDASCYPFIPLPHNVTMKSSFVMIERVRMTKQFLLTLAKHLRRFLGSKDNEIEVLAALQVLEAIKTLPNELVFGQEYLRKHKYLRLVHKRPLVSLAVPYLLELMESENKRVIRATRRVMSMFLEEMGVQSALPQ